MARTTQWTVYSADLDPVSGSEQAGRRPVLVVSREVINQALPIVAVVPLTRKRPGRKLYPTEVLLAAGAAGLPHESIALAHQVRTVSTRRLRDPYGHLADHELRDAVRASLRLYLDLE
jgi:mRNA interferase MazF